MVHGLYSEECPDPGQAWPAYREIPLAPGVGSGKWVALQGFVKRNLGLLVGKNLSGWFVRFSPEEVCNQFCKPHPPYIRQFPFGKAVCWLLGYSSGGQGVSIRGEMGNL